mmetsp:Transcript_35193/g.64265  ORF Transcript_35193/g.64265 Transcript_35193/m.64265 type:complete len:377 (+) Transcript_35193:103-1233(+)
MAPPPPPEQQQDDDDSLTGDEEGDRQRLAERLKEKEELQKELKKAQEDKKGAHKAGIAGIAAAKQQMAQLRAELALLESIAGGPDVADPSNASDKSQATERSNLADSLASNEGEEDEEDRPRPSADRSERSAAAIADKSAGAAEPSSEELEKHLDPHVMEEERERRHALQLQVRALRHALARWKHQFELLSAAREPQETEIVSLKADLTHTLDVLESTRHAVQHHLVDREMQGSQVAETGHMSGKVPLYEGGHGCVEVSAEQRIRERTEDRNVRLTTKSKKLTNIAAAQQLLIQRLEKQVLKEERQLQQKEAQLVNERQQVMMMQALLRQRSDTFVMDALGYQKPKQRASSASGAVSTADNSEPAARLPAIEVRAS